MGSVSNILWLGLKELRSFTHDVVLLALVVYSFSFAIYSEATGISQELHDASIAIVDEDRSPLSRTIGQAFLPPYFRAPAEISLAEVDRRMDDGSFTFVVDIPPDFQADLMAGRQPAIQVNVDATAMMQAGIGAGYIDQIISSEIARSLAGTDQPPAPPVELQTRFAFNPNLTSAWFTGVMAIINNVTILAVILAGAAVVREREHGTLDHLLVMPLRPFEIVLAKIWANGVVITGAAGLSLWLVIRVALGVPLVGSISLFMAGTALYLFFATAVGIYLGTIARSMPQLGLMLMLIVLPMTELSGSETPLESMPKLLQVIMQAVPSTHFVSFAQAILYRGAGIDLVWPQFLAVATIGGLFFVLALRRFRAAAMQGMS